ncbi:MAG TPA: hypothetical protein VIM75_22170 [Ohtaekwangia sp.]|uniref:hypothetical protein n=1 Tax=Ohtaekwangia sp. TaxID=2066019 RepID=UPI002F9286A3
MMKTIILLFIVWVPFLLQAQNITSATLSWQVTSVTDVNTGDILSTGGDQIISHVNKSVEWKDSQGNVKYTYAVNTVNGTWSNVSNNGSVIYQITANGKVGTIAFVRSGSEITIRILLLKEDGEDIPDMYEFKITGITTR